mmetsp:Transcript_18247/g.41963  ORF Transcript_18247/g.41963 Transcript_18247/m.41963 type:complete len:370 (+) Transcript_18247:330-1439(+)
MSRKNKKNDSDGALPDMALSSASESMSYFSGLTEGTAACNSNGFGSASVSRSTRSDDSSSLRRDREREGRCADCGMQTHELVRNRHTGDIRKIPLSIEEEVHRGRCLLCHPLPSRLAMSSRRNQLQQQQSVSMRHQLIQHQQLSNRSLQSMSDRSASSLPIQTQPMDFSIPPHSGHSIHSTPVNQMQFMRPQSTAAFSFAPADRPPIREFSIFSQSSAGHVQSAVPNGQATNSTAAVNHDTSEITLNSVSSKHSEEKDIPNILEDMRRYRDHTQTQSKCLHALWMLSWNNADARRIGQLGGISMIFDVMRCHPEIAIIQSNGMSTIQNLARFPDNRDRIIDYARGEGGEGDRQKNKRCKDHSRDHGRQH